MAFQGYLKEDTATTFRLGPFVDKTDGVTYEVGMAAAMNHGTTGVRISKNGGALAARTTATEPVYDAFGYYLVNLDATDVGTVGRLKAIFGDAAVCLPCEADFEILPANVFDSLMGTDLLDVSTVQIAGTAQTAGDIVAAIITNAAGADIAADIIALKAETVSILADTNELQVDDYPTSIAAIKAETALIVADTGELQTDWANGGRLDLILDIIAADTTTDIPALLATIDGIVDDILVDTAVIGALGAGLTAVPWNAAWDAEVQSEVNDALVANNLDHLALTATAAADMTTEVADNTILSRILGNGDTSTFIPSTDGLHAAAVDLDALITGVVTDAAGANVALDVVAVKAETAAIFAAVVTNAAGADIAADIIAVKAETAAIVADTAELQTDWANGGRLDLILDAAAVAGPTAAVVADAVWDEVRADHVTVGTFGEVATTADIVDDIWDELASGHVAAGSLGKAVADILADTNELQTDWHDGGRLDLLLDGAASAGDPWLTLIPGAYGAGTAGKILGDYINAPIATIDTVVDSIYTAVVTNAAGVDVAADIIALKAVADDILTDTGTTLQGEVDGIQTDTEDIQSRIPAALVSGRIDASVGAMAANVLTATAINADAITAAKIADGAIDAATFVAGAINAAAIAADAIGASELAADAIAEIVAAVWNALTTSYGGAGTYAQAIEDILADTNDIQTWWADGGRLDLILDAAASAGDPWVTALPGIYAAGSAGRIIGDNMNAPVATVDTIVDSILAMLTDIHATDLPAVKADTAGMPAAILATAYEGSETVQTVLRILRAFIAGLSTGHELGTPAFKSADGTKNRLSATVSADGNRSGVAVDGT